MKLNIITPGSHYHIKNKNKKESSIEDMYSTLEKEMKDIMESMSVTEDGELPNQGTFVFELALLVFH